MDLIAQADADPGTILKWVADYGLAIVLVVVLLCAFLYGFREWWLTYKPLYVARKQAEVRKEVAVSALFDTLREVEPMRAAAMQRQTEILEGVRTEQTKHAATCASSDAVLKEVRDKVHNLTLGHQMSEPLTPAGMTDHGPAEPFPLPPHESHLEPRPTRCICCGEPMEMYPMCPRCKAEKKAHELFTGTGEP